MLALATLTAETRAGLGVALAHDALDLALDADSISLQSLLLGITFTLSALCHFNAAAATSRHATEDIAILRGVSSLALGALVTIKLEKTRIKRNLI